MASSRQWGHRGARTRSTRDHCLFSLFYQVPDTDSLKLIYNTIGSSHFAPFDDSVKSLGETTTSVTMELTSTSSLFCPTPASFIIFNLRDLGKIFGLSQATPDKVATSAQFVRMWHNECLRVFHDRLISDEDKGIVSKLEELIKENFFDQDGAGDLLFDKVNDRRSPTCEIGNYGRSADLGRSTGHRQARTVLEAQGHLVLHRILRLKRARFAGRCRWQRQADMTKLASFVAECQVFEITLSRGYGESEFREDLKVLFGLVGAENKGGVPFHRQPRPAGRRALSSSSTTSSRRAWCRLCSMTASGISLVAVFATR